MDLNDKVSVTLFETGAKALNRRNRDAREDYPMAAEHFSQEYSEGDVFTAPLHEIFWIFTPHIRPDAHLPFHNLQKAE